MHFEWQFRLCHHLCFLIICSSQHFSWLKSCTKQISKDNIEMFQLFPPAATRGHQSLNPPYAAFIYFWTRFTNTCGSFSSNSRYRYSKHHVHHMEQLLQKQNYTLLLNTVCWARILIQVERGFAHMWESQWVKNLIKNHLKGKNVTKTVSCCVVVVI